MAVIDPVRDRRARASADKFLLNIAHDISRKLGTRAVLFDALDRLPYTAPVQMTHLVRPGLRLVSNAPLAPTAFLDGSQHELGRTIPSACRVYSAGIEVRRRRVRRPRRGLAKRR